MAAYYEIHNDYVQALDWYHKAAGTYEKALGKVHPNTITTNNKIARFYYRQGDYIKSNEWYQKDLNTAITYRDIAEVYIKMGSYQKALELYNKAYVIV